ncbi:MAG: redoxin domain-containing protein [Deltaproteobacteria bacterium]|nr:redoxin domain-containing protein [Deltaproteobacteria bacterium]
MKRIIIFLMGLALGTFFVWYFPAARKTTEVPVTPTSTSAIYDTLAGSQEWLNVSRPLMPADLQGRMILLDFWTYCCINCMHVIPDLQALEHEFGDDLTVIGVHSGKFTNERDRDNIRAAILRYDIEHPVVNDANFSIWDRLGVHAWPTLILINPEGKIERIYTGEGHREELRQDIEGLRTRSAKTLAHGGLPLALERTKVEPSVLRFPGKITFADDRNLLFVSDSNHDRILGFTLEGEVKVAIGKGDRPGRDDGTFEEARFFRPQGVLYHQGHLYVTDTDNHLLRSIDLEAKRVTTIAGTGVQGQDRFVKDTAALKTPLSNPWDVSFDPATNELVIAMAGTHQLWGYHLDKKTVRVIAGNGLESIDDGVYPENSLSQPSGISEHNGRHYFVDSETSSLRVLEGNRITTLIGTGLFDFGLKDGPRETARMQHSIGVFADGSGVYIADTYNHAIRFYDVEKKILSTLDQSHFNEPNDIVKIGNKLYVTDTNNHQIRVIDLTTRIVTTLHLTSLPSLSASLQCEGDACIPTSRSRV